MAAPRAPVTSSTAPRLTTSFLPLSATLPPTSTFTQVVDSSPPLPPTTPISSRPRFGEVPEDRPAKSARKSSSKKTVDEDDFEDSDCETDDHYADELDSPLSVRAVDDDCRAGRLGLLRYGNINFAPTRSSTLPLNIKATVSRHDALSTIVEKAGNKISFAVSAKSVYRLAEALQIADLQTLALTAIRSSLTAETAAHELFASPTTLHYPEVQRVVCDFVVANFDAVEKTATYEKFMTEIEDDARPEMAGILAKLLKAQRVKGKRQQESCVGRETAVSLAGENVQSYRRQTGGELLQKGGSFVLTIMIARLRLSTRKLPSSLSPRLHRYSAFDHRYCYEHPRNNCALLSHRSMSSDSDAYDFPSDEDGFDEDAYASDGLAEGERESKKDGAEEESPINLEAFRRDWLAEAAVKPKETPVERPSLRKNAFAHFLLHPDLLDDLVLSSPILSTDDLRSLSLTNSHFHSATVDFLFRKISLPSFVRADILLALLQCNPDLASSIRSATLELLNPLETCTELYEVELLRIANEEKENKQHVEYFWAPGRQSSVGRKPWEQQVYNSLLPGEDYDDVRTKARVRRRLQIAQALGQEKEYSKDGLRKVIQQRTSSWPFSATKRSSDRLGKLLDQLAPHLRHLTLLPPLSHYLPNLASHLSNFSSLQSLSLLGLASPHLRFGHGCAAGTAILQNRFSFAFPALDLRLDGHGFVGGPMSVRKHKLESFLLYWRRARRDVCEKGTEEDEEESGWKLEELEMRDVTIKRDPSHHPTTTPTAVTRVDSKKPPPTIRDSVWDPDPLLYLDLSAFVGSQAKLISLILVEVSGVVPSTIYEAVSKCGSSLRTLVLLDLNIPCDSYTPNTSSHSQSLSIDFSFTRRTPTQRYGQRKTFDNLVSLADLWYRFDAPSSSPYQLADSTYWPSTTLAEALKRCLSLRHLELGVSISRAGNSPYPPAMLDGLLVARPPLEVLKLRMGVEGPTQEDGLLDSEGWEKIAGQVEEIGTWKTLKMGQSGVMVSLRTSGRA